MPRQYRDKKKTTTNKKQKQNRGFTKLSHQDKDFLQI
jgi:hypothetical protein